MKVPPVRAEQAARSPRNSIKRRPREDTNEASASHVLATDATLAARRGDAGHVGARPRLASDHHRVSPRAEVTTPVVFPAAGNLAHRL